MLSLLHSIQCIGHYINSCGVLNHLISPFCSGTQTDSGDTDDDPSVAYDHVPSPQKQLEKELLRTKAQLLAVQAELESVWTNAEIAARETTAALAQLQHKLQKQKEQAAIFKFGLE